MSTPYALDPDRRHASAVCLSDQLKRFTRHRNSVQAHRRKAQWFDLRGRRSVSSHTLPIGASKTIG